MKKYLYTESSMAKHIQLLLDKGSRLFGETRSADSRSGNDEDQDVSLDHSNNTRPKNKHLTPAVNVYITRSRRMAITFHTQGLY